MAHRPEPTAAPRFREGERRLAAIAFTDVVGYSGVVHRNEKLGQRMVDRQDKVVRAVLPLFDGHVVKSTGDGFLIEFGSALSAVKALATIQARLATDDEAAACPVPLRTSVHLGDVDHVRGDLYGDGVNIAARLMPLSPEGGLAISTAVRMQVRQQLSLELRSIGTPALKNIDAPLEVFVADPPALHALARELEAEVKAAEASAAPSSPRRRTWVKPAAAVGVALLVLAVGLGIVQRTRTAGPAPDPSHPALAVLPFANTGGDPANEYFSDGLSEELITTLGRVSNLKVMGRASSFQFKNTKDDPRTIGQKLGVGYLVDGSVRKASDRVRIGIALVRTDDGSNLWTDSYDRDLKDIFAVQSEIATAVTGELQRSLKLSTIGPGSQDASTAGRPPSGNVEAYQALLQGKFYARRHTKSDEAKAIQFYERAIALDPRYALAHAELAGAAFASATTYAGVAPAEAAALLARSRAAAAEALRLDPALAQAHIARAQQLQGIDLRLEDAEREVRRAVQLAPQDPAMIFRLGSILAERGNAGTALEAFDRSVALDPLSRDTQFRRGMMLNAIGRNDEAETAFLKALELEPQAVVTHAYLAVTKLHQGDSAAAVTIAREETDPFWRTWALAMALFAHGDRAEADAALNTMIRENADDAAYQIAEIYALRRDPDAVFHWLDQALAIHDPGVTQLFTSSLLAAYRDDPRYVVFARKVGLDSANAPPLPKGAARAKGASG